jgi:RNA polymerase sigma factor (sigma-70 family)
MYRRNRPAPIPTLYGGELGSSPQEILEANDMQRMLEEALDLLKPRERQLFEMRQLEGLSVDEISSETGIPKPSITAMVSAARKKVFTELKRRMKQ